MGNDTIEKINLGVGLADSELISYCYNGNENTLTIKIKAWNGKLVELIFSDLLSFYDHGGNFLSLFRKNNDETDLFIQTIRKTYDIRPLKTPYKLFQFIDIDDKPCLEIICEDFVSKIFD